MAGGGNQTPAKDDRFEDNDTVDTATPLSPGALQLQGLDTDVFAFELDGERNISLAIEGPTGDLDMCLLDAGGNTRDARRRWRLRNGCADDGDGHGRRTVEFRHEPTAAYSPEMNTTRGAGVCGSD